MGYFYGFFVDWRNEIADGLESSFAIRRNAVVYALDFSTILMILVL